MKEILITTPHSLCDRWSPFRNCDRLAAKRAHQIQEKIRSLGGTVTLISADLPREEIDLNRLVSRYTTAFRDTVRQLLSERQVGLVLDIHSYPIGTKDWDYYKAVLLQDAYPFPSDSIRLRNAMSVPLYRGMNNDIIDEVQKKYKIPAILIEFREDERDDVESEVREIAKWAISLTNK